MNPDAALTQTAEGVLLRLLVHPGARREQVTGLHDDRIKVAVTEPADRGRANAAVIRFLSQLLGISRTDIHLLRGETSRRKDLLLAGYRKQHIADLLRQIPD